MDLSKNLELKQISLYLNVDNTMPDMQYSFYSLSMRGFFSHSFDVFHEEHKILTAEKSSFFSMGDYDFVNNSGKVVLSIRKPFTLFNKKFHLYENEQEVGNIESAVFGNHFTLESGEITLITKGNFFGTEFTVLDGSKEIAKITRERFARKRAYKVAVQEGYNDFHIIALIVTISTVRRMRKNNG